MNDDEKNLEILAETPHLRLVRRGRWVFVQRVGSTGVVCIVAVTDDGNVLLVEQYRPPVDARVIEFPAGLAGDVPGEEEELLERAAHRELLEETGYEAQSMERIAAGVSSAGLTDETITFFRARDLTRVDGGGGDASEDIIVHEVPLSEIDSWLAGAVAQGCLIDAKVFACLYWLKG